jgi:hypothetical protein
MRNNKPHLQHSSRLQSQRHLPLPLPLRLSYRRVAVFEDITLAAAAMLPFVSKENLNSERPIPPKCNDSSWIPLHTLLRLPPPPHHYKGRTRDP